ncbi:hypothetical protein [Streptomyces syringium]|uniref:hypothetical protein n=1 Tax=Streptomyces syringium TaxID=76729 RepID=UPI00340D24F4
MTENKDLTVELRSIVADIARLAQEQNRELEVRWPDGDVPADELRDYDEKCYDHFLEASDLLGKVHRRLGELIEPKAAA